MKNRMRLVTTSEISTAMQCPRLHFYRYVKLRRLREQPPALRFGSLMHDCEEAWWLSLMAVIAALRAAGEMPADSYDPSRLTDEDRRRVLVAALAPVEREKDPFEQAKARAMIIGYHERWIGEAIEPLAVERQFETPLIDPETGDGLAVDGDDGTELKVLLAGKIDVIARRYGAGGLVEDCIIEHKTSSEDVQRGSTYWQVLATDPQVSVYFDGARAIGYDVAACIYDVLSKPRLTPQTATPEDKRETTIPKYKACPECKKKGGEATAPHVIATDVGDVECGKGYNVGLPGGGAVAVPGEAGKVLSELPRYKSHVRIADETPAEYEARLLADYRENLAARFVRGDIARLDNEMAEHRADVFAWAERLLTDAGARRVPRNRKSCRAYGRLCDFYDVCAGRGSLDDAQFIQISSPHAELAEPAE